MSSSDVVGSLALIPGQAADYRQARALLEGVPFERLIGDHGYDTNEIRDWLEEHQARRLSHPSATGRRRSRTIRKPTESRHQIENLFCRIKDYGRITLRKDKTERSYAAFLSLAFALVNIQLCP